jgi:peptide deformylase
MRRILQIGEPALSIVSEKVKDFKDPELKKLIADMLEICIAKDEISAGLSAPQLGINLQICFVRRMDLEEKTEHPVPLDKLWVVLINPRIIENSKSENSYWEGCLSVGDGPDGLFAPVSRPSRVKIEFETIEGKTSQLTCTRFFSHVVQHEIDHLNGILFLKYITNPENIWKSKDLDEYYQKNEEYPPVR